MLTITIYAIARGRHEKCSKNFNFIQNQLRLHTIKNGRVF